MRARRNRKRLAAVFLTLIALAAVVWVALRQATPFSGQSRVVLSGSRSSSPGAGRFTPEYVGVDRQTGDVTVVARDGHGRRSKLVLPKATAPRSSPLTASPSEDANVPGG